MATAPRALSWVEETLIGVWGGAVDGCAAAAAESGAAAHPDADADANVDTVRRCVAAVESDDAEALAAALDAARQLEVDGAVNGGRTLLHFTGPGWRCASHLLYHGARADVLADDGGTALTHAARRGHRDVAGALLAWGASTVSEDARGETPFLAAANAGHAELAQDIASGRLAEHGARLLGLAPPAAAAPPVPAARRVLSVSKTAPNTGLRRGQKFKLAGKLSFGASPAQNDVVLDDVSGRAEVSCARGRVKWRQIDGATKGAWSVLAVAASFRLGATTFVLEEEEAPLASTTPPPAAVPRRAVGAGAATLSAAFTPGDEFVEAIYKVQQADAVQALETNRRTAADRAAADRHAAVARAEAEAPRAPEPQDDGYVRVWELVKQRAPRVGLGSQALAQPLAPRHGAHPAAKRAQLAALTKFRFDHTPKAAGGPAFVAATAADGDLAQSARPDARRREEGKRSVGEIGAKRVRFDVPGERPP
ncbi:hypothetical protein M885DRAFT_547617 [Pelagophyceae sp. CCMP2097]|nr:hypothetical protein M885DRAFT_547617 [Pelagophyceae sp. CCMP2097]